MSKTNLVAFLLILKTYFELKQCTLLFQNEKAYSGNYARDGGFNLMKTGGLLSNFTREGVSATESRWIKDDRLRLDQGNEREGDDGRNSDTSSKLHGQRRGGHRCSRLGAYGPRFEEPKAPGDGGGSREPVQAKNGASGRGWRGGRHGRRARAHGRPRIRL